MGFRYFLSVRSSARQYSSISVREANLPEYFMAEWKMRIGFNQFHHPLLVVLELDIMVVDILVNMTLQLVNKLLFSEAIEFLWNEYLVVTECRDNSLDKGKAFKKAAYLMNTSTNEPAFGDQFFNLLGIGHDGKPGTVEIVAYALPARKGLHGLWPRISGVVMFFFCSYLISVALWI